jgi:predicted phage terminase large subunit-like protein
VSEHVVDVLLTRSVCEIAHDVVRRISVQVSNIHSFFLWAKERVRDGLMHPNGMRFAFDTGVAVGHRTGGLENLASKEVLPAGAGNDLVPGTDSARVANFVSGCPDYRTPLFVTDDGHASSTYCLTVEDYNTFYVGNSYIVSNCIDDPHNVVDSDSEASRISTLEWWDQAIPTRLNDPKKGGFIIIMQRVHERDLSGHILKSARPNEWDHLCLPAEYEAKPLHQVQSSLGFRDPRTKEGELLWPDRFGAGELDTLKRSLGEYGAASQLQQRPAPIGGGLINTKFFQLYPSNRPLPAFDFIVQSYDTAFTDKTKNDPTACTTWGVFTPSPTVDAPSPPPCVMLLDAWHDHLKYPQLRLRMRDEFKFHYGDNPARSPDIIVIESKGSGLSLIADLQRDGLPVRAYNPLRADKTSRIQQCLPIIEDKRVFILESKKHKGEPVDWAAGLLRECSYFPVGEHDDYVDTLSQCLLYLRDASFVVLQERTYDPDEDPDAEHRKRRAGNPYAA